MNFYTVLSGRAHVFTSACVMSANAQAVSPEVLRQYGLSLLHSHSVLLTRTRACPLEPSTLSLPVPEWKLIRTPKKMTITDEARSACERKIRWEKEKWNKR